MTTGIRQRVDHTIDAARFRLDTFPKLPYQPLPQIGKPNARRAEGVVPRWQAIWAACQEPEPRSVVDIGSQAGFYTLQMAARGIPVVAVERVAHFSRITDYAARQVGRSDRIGTLRMDVTPTTVALLPRGDVVIFLAVWHHFAKAYGVVEATTMLRTIWARTDRVLFFETGEAEMPPSFGLPAMLPNSRDWLGRMLADECSHSQVDWLGSFSASGPNGEKGDRNLFAVRRVN